jgi:hypothetical protein
LGNVPIDPVVKRCGGDAINYRFGSILEKWREVEQAENGGVNLLLHRRAGSQ